MLLRQVFPGSNIQMISSVINPRGAISSHYARVDEYIYIVEFGDNQANVSSSYAKSSLTSGSSGRKTVSWRSMLRYGTGSKRGERPNQFYPIYVEEKTGKILGTGFPVGVDYDVSQHKTDEGVTDVWPINGDGSWGNWRLIPDSFKAKLEQGYARAKRNGDSWAISDLLSSEIENIESGKIIQSGIDENGVAILDVVEELDSQLSIRSQWNESSHNASSYGTSLTNAFFGEKRFDFPKSLYAVEDVMRFFVKSKPNATIIDFFGGSGTTAHAVMRLNEQDGGSRNSITITNNEVSLQDNKKFSLQVLQSGDPDWEKYGVYEYAT